jgi:hypothetical protein
MSESDQAKKPVNSIGDLTPKEIETYFGGPDGLEKILRRIYRPDPKTPEGRPATAKAN